MRSMRRSQTAPGSGTIIDDDAQPTISVGNATVTEGDTGTINANFTVSPERGER